MSSKADRSTFIGGSDAAGVLGLSKYATPLDVFKKKKGLMPAPGPEQKKIFRRGHLLEPVILEIARLDHGLEVVKASTPEDPNYYHDAEHPFLACEVDFEWQVTNQFIDMNPHIEIDPALIGTIQNGDCKSASQFVAGEFGEEGTDEVLIDHTMQAQHGMGIMGRQLCLFVVMFGSYHVGLYLVKRDDELIATARAKMVDFWHNNLVANIEPEPVNADDMRWLIARTVGHPVMLTPELYEMLAEIERSRDAQKNVKEALEFQMLEVGRYVLTQWKLNADSPEAEDARLLFDGREVATWKKQGNGHFDSKSLQADQPTLHAQYMRRGFHRVLRIK